MTQQILLASLGHRGGQESSTKLLPMLTHPTHSRDESVSYFLVQLVHLNRGTRKEYSTQIRLVMANLTNEDENKLEMCILVQLKPLASLSEEDYWSH